MKFDHLPELVVTGEDSEKYGVIVKKTAALLKKPYGQMHVLFTRERWSIEEIERAYQNATKHNGNLSPEICWWASRKRRNGV